jgi:predicted nucleotidyltransferase
MTDFAGLLSALTAHGVRFIIVGGTAATAHGSVRLTLDLDVVYDRAPENLTRLVSALAPHRPYLRGAPPGLPFAWDLRTLARGLNFTLTTAIGDIDLLGEVVGGGTYEKLIPHSVEMTLFGHGCRTVDIEKLIDLKRAAGRPKDLEAIAELEEILDIASKKT